MRTVFLAIALLLTPLAWTQTSNFDALIEAGHFKQLARSLNTNSHDPETLYLLSNVKQAFGNIDEATRYAEEAVKSDPSRAKYHLQLASTLSDQTEKAGLFKKMSLAGRIRSELETAVKLEPKNTDCLMSMMIFYDQAPGIAGGSKQKARQMAEDIARIDASKGYLAQARLAQDNKEPESRIEQLYVNAVMADPRSLEALVAAASFCASAGEKKYDSAQQYAEKALSLDGRSAAYAIAADRLAAEESYERLRQAVHGVLVGFHVNR